MRLHFVLLLLLGACSSSHQGSTTNWSPEVLQVNQLERTAQFDSLVGRGVIGFTWTDEKGTHKEQGDLDFWKQGNAISLRITKLGELIAWFGGEGKAFWFFDFMGDEPTLTLGGEHGMFNDIEIALILLGLSPLPDGEMTTSDGKLTLLDEQQRRWVVTFDAAGNRPLSIELTDGEHHATAVHGDEIGVEIDQLHELHWPMTGGKIELKDNQGNTDIKIIFSSLSTIVEDEPMQRVMDLEYLQGALKPVRILEGN